MVNALPIDIVNFIANQDDIYYGKKIFSLDLIPPPVAVQSPSSVQNNSAAVQSNSAAVQRNRAVNNSVAVQSNSAAVQTGGIRKTIHRRNKTLKLRQITRLKNKLSLKNI